MRYIILNKKISMEEIKSRKKYIEKVTNMYFIPYKIEGGIEFKSIPLSTIDCLLIIGHNLNVKRYLEYNNILEKNIVIVSCSFSIDNRMKEDKNIYVSYDLTGRTNYYNGKQWNLDFYVSKEELKIINSIGTFMERVKKYFRRII